MSESSPVQKYHGIISSLKLIAVATITVNAVIALLLVLEVITAETFNQLFFKVLCFAGIIAAATIAIGFLARKK